MEISELTAMLTDGLPADQAAIVKAAIERDSVKAKAAGLKAQAEFDAIQTRAATLQQELEGTTDKPGSRAYQKWYNENYAAIEKLNKDVAAYDAKHGAGAYQTMISGGGAPPTPSTGGGRVLSEEEVQRLVDKRIQEGYAPRWSDLLTNTGDLVQRHMFAGRKTPIDFTAVSKLAGEKYNGNLSLAYDEYDRPEREKQAKLDEDARVEKRVQDEVAKRQAAIQFPSGADFTPSTLSTRPKTEVDGFDKAKLQHELARDWAKTGQPS